MFLYLSCIAFCMFAEGLIMIKLLFISLYIYSQNRSMLSVYCENSEYFMRVTNVENCSSKS